MEEPLKKRRGDRAGVLLPALGNARSRAPLAPLRRAAGTTAPMEEPLKTRRGDRAGVLLRALATAVLVFAADQGLKAVGEGSMRGGASMPPAPGCAERAPQ